MKIKRRKIKKIELKSQIFHTELKTFENRRYKGEIRKLVYQAQIVDNSGEIIETQMGLSYASALRKMESRNFKHYVKGIK